MLPWMLPINVAARIRTQNLSVVGQMSLPAARTNVAGIGYDNVRCEYNVTQERFTGDIDFLYNYLRTKSRLWFFVMYRNIFWFWTHELKIYLCRIRAIVTVFSIADINLSWILLGVFWSLYLYAKLSSVFSFYSAAIYCSPHVCHCLILDAIMRISWFYVKFTMK